MRAGHETRGSVLAGCFLACYEESYSAVAPESVFGGCRVVGVVDWVIAVEDLVFGSWADAEDDGVVELWLAC